MILFDSLPKNVKTNEDYLNHLKKDMKTTVIAIIIGIVTITIAILNEVFGFVEDNSLVNGLYAGLGTGIVIISIIGMLRSKKVMKNETLLKEERLKKQDERNQLIAGKALKAATATILLISYAAVLIAGFYSKVVFFCFWFIAVVFGISYQCFIKYYNKKM